MQSSAKTRAAQAPAVHPATAQQFLETPRVYMDTEMMDDGGSELLMMFPCTLALSQTMNTDMMWYITCARKQDTDLGLDFGTGSHNCKIILRKA